MNQIQNILTDKGSKYAASEAEAESNGTCLKSDDGESGAVMIILNVLKREEVFDHLIARKNTFFGCFTRAKDSLCC